jgi:hypothetical protein
MMDDQKKQEVADEWRPHLEEAIRRMTASAQGVLSPRSLAENPFAELAVQMTGQAIMNRYKVSKSEATEIIMRMGILPESTVHRAGKV